MTPREKALEAAARASCASRGTNPDTLFQCFTDDEPCDATDSRGVRYFYAWRKSVPHVTAAITAFEAEMKGSEGG